MRRTFSRSLILGGAAALCAAGLALGRAATDAGARVAGTTEFAAEPGGERLGVILPGAEIRILERQGEWARVEVSGWIPAAAIAGELSPGSAAQAVPPETLSPSVPASPAQEEAPSSVSGLIAIAGRKGKALPASGVLVLLVNDPEGAGRAAAPVRAECGARREALLREVEEKGREAEKAMKTIENTSRAFEAYDEAKAARAARLTDLRRLDGECAAREAEALAPFAASRTITSADGRFLLERVGPGRYVLMASFEAEKNRHRWEMEVSVEAGRDLALQLSEANRSSVEPVPSYR